MLLYWVCFRLYKISVYIHSFVNKQGFGNLFGILCVAYFAESQNKESRDEEENRSKISLQGILIWFNVTGLVSCIGLYIITSISWYNELFVFILIGLNLIATNGSSMAGLILIGTEVPSLQQPRAFAIISIIESITGFIAQASLATIYKIDGMRFESLLLLILWLISILAVIQIYRMMFRKKSDIELEWINKNKEVYT